MKILLCGYRNPHFKTFCDFIEQAIKALGHEFEFFNYRKWLIPGRIRERLDVFNQWDIERINASLIKEAQRVEPDVLLCTGAWTIQKETIQTITKKAKAVNWVADFPLKFDEYLQTGPSYSHVFFSGTEALERYKAAGASNASWLPFACDPEIHQPVEVSEEDRKKYACDISFIGSCYTERIEILERLTDFDIKIWGPGWDKADLSAHLRARVQGGAVDVDEWRKIIHCSKINLNIIGHRCDVMEPYVDADEFRMTNTKLFEILGCGGFQCVDQKADAETLFKHKEHVVFYKDSNELISLIQHYIKHDNERRQIAEQGRKEVLAKHTYVLRLKELLRVVMGVTAQ